MRIVVLGINDVASAVTHRLWTEGFLVFLLSGPEPAVSRRGMAFVDAVFDGAAELEGVRARRVDEPDEATLLAASREAVPVLVTREPRTLVGALAPAVLVDARMRKRASGERWRGCAPLTIGLGPGFVAGEQVDVAVETSWEELGRVRWEGANLPLAGEPREIGGLRRERYVYAPCAGRWRTARCIGDLVEAGEPVAWIECDDGRRLEILAPASGAVRGLTRDGVTVSEGTKVLEIDPRGSAGQWRGLGQRPRGIADGVLEAVLTWQRRVSSERTA
jgi:xanthine dehydrogenase accessory factor